MPIPSVVKRNTILFALSQAFVGAGMQMLPALGALMVVQLTNSAALAGVGASLVGASRFLIAYPAGKISDRFGRKPGLVLGLALGLVGAVLTGLAMAWASLPLLLVGFLVFGLGMGAAQQIRVAAADMYPPSRRGEGLGYVLTGSLLGALLAPAIVRLAQGASPRLNLDPMALAWLLAPGVILPSILLVLLVRPDPKVIASNLGRYYPDYRADPLPADGDGAKVSLLRFLRHYPKLAAFVASLAVQGNMAMLMFMTSLVLHEHGHSLAAISLSVSIHVIGMFGFSVPLGWLTDRLGRRNVLLAGVAIAGAGALLVPSSPLFWVITSGTFLVGLGWSCVNVAATALLADTSAPGERGRVIGANDTFSQAAGIVLPLLAGPMAQALGLGSVGLLGMSLMLAPFALLARLREPRPGRYGQPVARAEEA